MLKRTVLLLAILITTLTSACAGGLRHPAPTPVKPVSGMPSGTDGFPWWNDTVFYEIFVRSFFDTNGDGIGDFNGITAKLDYLQSLGVSGLWLMPINPSSSYHGYDVTDYRDVNPDYGTLDDFKHLLDEAHRRGMRIIIDLVLNHSSSQNPWFLQSQDPASPYRDWYIWSQEKPGYSGPENQIVWHEAAGGGYYYGVFGAGMPDLNYANPAVTAEMEDVVRFWLEDVGVDGFRLDAAKYLIEEGTNQANTEATHAWYRALRTFYKGIAPQALTIGEVWDSTFAAGQYAKGDQLDLVFDFDLANALMAGAAGGNARKVGDVLTLDGRVFKPGQFGVFLTNHDMNRVMTQVIGNVDKARVAAVLLLTMPGVPFIYYGEEIGMSGSKPDPDIRTPMQWSDAAGAGFTSGTPWRPANPDAARVNVAAQEGDPDSLLALYKELIALRGQHAALRIGDATRVTTGNGSVFAMLRSSPDEAILVVANLGNLPVKDYALSLDNGPLSGKYRVVGLLGEGQYPRLAAGARGGFDAYQPLAELPPYGWLALQLQPIR